MPGTLQQLTRYENLLALGMSLVMAGLILRGFAASSRRDQARRKQHRLDDRKSAATALDHQLARSPGWVEQHLGQIANAVLIAGLLITIAAFWRR